jgi:phytol kinase
VWIPSLPPLAVSLWLAPLLALLAIGAGYLSGWLKLRRGFRTGDTRKIFHFTIFAAAAVLSRGLGFEAVNLLGGVVALYVLALLRLGDGNVFYEGLARESDRPQRSFYIVLPFLATAAGGILSTLFFGGFATVGFAVAGCADALAEPIGIRFGKHRYRVPNFGGGVTSSRSLEGSVAVLAASFLAAVLVLWVLRDGATGGASSVLLSAAVIAVLGTVVEAISHHGLDNLTLQVVASGIAHFLLG